MSELTPQQSVGFAKNIYALVDIISLEDALRLLAGAYGNIMDVRANNVTSAKS